MAGYLIPAPADPAERAAWEAAIEQRAHVAAPARLADMPRVGHHRGVIEYLDAAQVGEWFGVSGGTVIKWRSRYAETHPCPAPDAMTGGRTPGWLPEREAEWRAWESGRVGQGAAGTSKPGSGRRLGEGQE